jgi:hypothetical protein
MENEPQEELEIQIPEFTPEDLESLAEPITPGIGEAAEQTPASNTQQEPASTETGNNTFAESFNEVGGDADVSNPLKALQNASNYPAAMGAGVVDTVTDLANWITGPARDPFNIPEIPKLPKYESKVLESVRDMSGLIIPSLGLRAKAIQTGTKLHKAKLAAPWMQRLGNSKTFEWFSKFGIDVGTGGFVDYIAKQNQEDHNATGMLKKHWPKTYQFIPDTIATLDSDSSDTKRSKNVNEGAVFNVLSSVVEGSAYLLKAGKSLDKTTKFIAQNPKAQKRIEELTTDEFSKIKFSDNPIEDTVLRNYARKEKALDELGEAKVNGTIPIKDPNQPVLGVHDVFSDKESLTRTKDPDGILGAAVDQARIDNTIDTTYGRLGNPISEAALKVGLDPANMSERTLIKELAENLKEGGVYSKQLANGKKITSAQIKKSGERLSEILLDPRMEPGDMMKLLDEFKRAVGDTELKVINRKGSEGVKLAIKSLKENIIDLDVQKARAYLVTSLGGQISDISEGIRLMDDTTVMRRAANEIADRIEYLMIEKGVANFEAGTYRSNLNAWEVAADTKDPQIMGQAAKAIEDEIKSKINELIPNVKEYTNTIREIAEVNPDFLKSFMLANELTDGDVNSLYKLNHYVSNSLGVFKKALYDGNPDIPPMINKAFLGNIFNSVLSAFSTPIKALVGNLGGLSARPIATMAGAALEGDWHIMHRAMWSHFSLDDTLTKSLSHAGLVFKKASLEPRAISYAMREDIALKKANNLDMLWSYAKAAEEQDEFGASALLHVYENLETMAENPVLRFGTNAMTGLDGFSRSVTGHVEAKARAFDKLIQEGREIDKDAFFEVKDQIFKEMQDENGMITDKAVEYLNSEIALNLDSPLVKGFNAILDRFPIIKPHFMFPRTSANVLATVGRYSPFGTFSKEYQQLFGPLGARKIESFPIEEIKEILERRGKNFDANYMTEFRQIRAEVKGKVALGTVVTMAALGAYRSGRLRGAGHWDKSRQRVRTKTGWVKNTFQGLDGGWYDYAWLGPLGEWLSTVVTVADNADSLSTSKQEEFWKKLSFVFASSFTNKSLLSNVEPLNDILQGNGSAFNRWASSFGNAILPLSGQRNELGRVMNPTLREIKAELGDSIRNRNNWLDAFDPQGALPESYDFIDGNKIRYPENFFVRAWNAYSPMKRHDNPSELHTFLQKIEYNANPQMNSSTGGVELTNTERSAIFSKMGEQGVFKRELQKIKRYAENIEYNGTKGFTNILREQRKGGIGNELFAIEDYKKVYSRIRKAFESSKKLAEASLSEEMLSEIRNREFIKRASKSFTEKGAIDQAIDVQLPTEDAYPEYILQNK